MNAISLVKKIVEKELRKNGDHDYSHTMRVYANAMKIAKKEKCDPEIVALASLLHDISEGEGHRMHHLSSAKRAREILTELKCPERVISGVERAVLAHRFSMPPEPSTIEAKIVQDADRLDALGAVGIARCFSFGGRFNRKLYDERNLIREKTNPKKSRTQASVDHFYLKLLNLKDKMHTKTARKIALERTKFMEKYLKQFGKEIRGEA
ncbi:MAG: HD domain-containing protein [archaeon]